MAQALLHVKKVAASDVLCEMYWNYGYLTALSNGRPIVRYD